MPAEIPIKEDSPRRIPLKPGERVLVEAVLGLAQEDVSGIGKGPKVDAEFKLRRFVRVHDLEIGMLEGAGPDDEIALLTGAKPEILEIIVSVRKEEMLPQRFLDTVVGTWANTPQCNLTPEQMSDRARVLFDFFAKVAETIQK